MGTSAGDGSARPVAGWYTNPHDPLTQRYWNGEAWTQDVAPAAPFPAGPPRFAAPPVGYQAYGAPTYGWAAPVSTNGLAVASLVLGILWIYWLGSLLAVIFGHVALVQIKNSGGRQGGRGLAIAGLTLGWVGVGILALVLFIAAAASTG